MGKGSNVQKAQAARERNQAKLGKTDEERAEARKKAAADSEAFKCKICMQTFMCNVKMELLYNHVTARHDDKKASPGSCFDQLVGYDPTAPVAAAAAAVVVKPKKKNKADGLEDLFSAGLSLGKKKK